jgi:uncharacterized phage infection (PIP) family protein YhgE
MEELRSILREELLKLKEEIKQELKQETLLTALTCGGGEITKEKMEEIIKAALDESLESGLKQIKAELQEVKKEIDELKKEELKEILEGLVKVNDNVLKVNENVIFTNDNVVNVGETVGNIDEGLAGMVDILLKIENNNKTRYAKIMEGIRELKANIEELRREIPSATSIAYSMRGL